MRKVILLLSAMALFSCSSDDSDNTANNDPNDPNNDNGGQSSVIKPKSYSVEESDGDSWTLNFEYTDNLITKITTDFGSTSELEYENGKLFSILAITGKFELNKLEKLEKGKSSYEYMKTFDEWIKNLLNRFSFLYRIWIPLLFIGFILGILKTNLFVPFIGSTIADKLVRDSDMISIGSVPILWIFVILLIASSLSYFSNRYFRLEMKSIYGNLISRLDNILIELEELR